MAVKTAGYMVGIRPSWQWSAWLR